MTAEDFRGKGCGRGELNHVLPAIFASTFFRPFRPFSGHNSIVVESSSLEGGGGGGRLKKFSEGS